MSDVSLVAKRKRIPRASEIDVEVWNLVTELWWQLRYKSPGSHIAKKRACILIQRFLVKRKAAIREARKAVSA